MRLKVKKLLKGGEYFISLQSMGYNPEGTEKIKKFGMPTVDFSSNSLGTHKLDQIELAIKCQSAEEAEQMTNYIKQNIKDKLTELMARVDNFTGEKVVKIYSKGKTLILGLACVSALLLLSAYKGGILSQQITARDKQLFASAQTNAIDETIGNEGKVAFLEGNQASPHDPVANHQNDNNDEGMPHAYAKGSSGRANSGSMTSMRPDFAITAVPGTLVRYSEWGSNIAGSGDKANYKHFKLILTPLGGFEGPVTLGVSGCSMLKRYLYPTQIEKLPGSSTLLVFPSPKSPPQICSDITVIARGQTPSGDLITHEKKLVLAVRQKSSYQGPVWHVSTLGSDQSGDGGWGSPFRTIQRGIDCARAGDTVLVERGLYKENINLTNKDRILLASHFIFGQKESTIKSTIIEAKKPGWVITIGRSDQVTLRGFTIQKGKGENGSFGGGIYCYHSNPNIFDNIITKNENHSGHGAGIFCYDCRPNILRNHITQNYNYDGHGAGIYCFKSDPDIEHNVISGNYASGGGSGIHLLEARSVRIIRNLIYGDSGSSALILYHNGLTGDFQVLNNTISHNQGDGVRYFGGTWVFKNNIITHNDGYGLFTFEGTVYLAHNNVWGNVSGSDTMNYYGWGESSIKNNGNVSEDPCFGNSVHGNFHLSFDSPCIDSGDPNDPVPPEGGHRIDMGAIEYTHPDMVCGDMNRDGFIDFGDVDYLANFLSGKISAPDPYQIGDVNCDDEINKRDLSYLYKFLYYYGPEPCTTKNRNLTTFKNE